MLPILVAPYIVYVYNMFAWHLMLVAERSRLGQLWGSGWRLNRVGFFVLQFGGCLDETAFLWDHSWSATKVTLGRNV